MSFYLHDGGRKLLSEFDFAHESSDKHASICKSCLANDLDLASSENWDDVGHVCNLIEETLRKDHVQFSGRYVSDVPQILMDLLITQDRYSIYMKRFVIRHPNRSSLISYTSRHTN